VARKQAGRQGGWVSGLMCFRVCLLFLRCRAGSGLVPGFPTVGASFPLIFRLLLIVIVLVIVLSIIILVWVLSMLVLALLLLHPLLLVPLGPILGSLGLLLLLLLRLLLFKLGLLLFLRSGNSDLGESRVLNDQWGGKEFTFSVMARMIFCLFISLALCALYTWNSPDPAPALEPANWWWWGVKDSRSKNPYELFPLLHRSEQKQHQQQQEDLIVGTDCSGRRRGKRERGGSTRRESKQRFPN